MLCATLPYNENDAVRIEKDRCYNYRIINKTGCPMTVSVNRISSGSTAFYEEHEIPCLGSISIVLPSDGIYVLKGVGPETLCPTLTIDESQLLVPAPALQISVFDIGVNNAANAMTFVSDSVQSINAYDSGADGASTVGVPANLLVALDAYGTTTGQPYTRQFRAPGVAFTGGADWATLYGDTTGYRLLVGFVGAKMDEFVVDGITYTPVANAVSYLAPTVPVGFNYATGIQIDGNEQMSCPTFYDVDDTQGAIDLVAAVQNGLAPYGTLWNTPGPDETAGLIIADDFVFPTLTYTLSSGTVEDIYTNWCTQFWEFCRLWDCVQTKIAEWLCCEDPCAPKCDNPPSGADFLDLMMDLTLYGMFPLLTQHHIWQFGNLSDDEGANLTMFKATILGWDRWYKMLEGCGCAPGRKCDCGEIGITRFLSQSPIVQPPNCKTCG